VVLVDLNEDGLEEASATLGGVQTIVTDVSDAQQIEDMFAQVQQKHGKLDILVNNAAIVIYKDFLDHTPEDWDRVFAVNLRAVFLACKGALGPMIDAGKGSIVNIASMGALIYTGNHIAYAASKAGVVTLTRELACEVGQHGIRVNAIAPGPTDSSMMREMIGDDEVVPQGERMLLGRFGETSDIGEAAAYLCSDAAGYVTGITMQVAGGLGLAAAKP